MTSVVQSLSLVSSGAKANETPTQNTQPRTKMAQAIVTNDAACTA